MAKKSQILAKADGSQQGWNLLVFHRRNNLAGLLITLQTRDDGRWLLEKTLAPEGASLRYTAWEKTHCLAAADLF